MFDTSNSVCAVCKCYTEGMQSEEEKLNAIVGSALKAMVESGVDEKVLGAFAFAHRNKVANILGIQTAAQQEQALRAQIAEELVQQVAKDLGQTLSATLAKISAHPKKIRKNIVINGSRTAVTVDEANYQSLVQSKGEDGALAALNDLASKTPKDVANRSGWINTQIQSLVALQDMTAQSTRH